MILVAGATGSVGGRITLELLESGERVRVLVRRKSDHARLQAAGAELAIGDVKDAASVARACRGSDIVISTATASKRNDDTVANVDGQGTQNLIAAADQAGAGHFILVSTVGASPDSPVALFRAKGEAEARLRASGMVHTILQPAPFMDVWFPLLVELPVHGGQPVTLVGESKRRHAFIAERDVAAFAVAATRTPAARNATIPIGGPEAVTWREVVQAYEAAVGQPIALRSVPPGAPIPGLPEPVWALAASLERFDTIIPMAELAGQFGVELTSVGAYARSRAALVAS